MQLVREAQTLLLNHAAEPKFSQMFDQDSFTSTIDQSFVNFLLSVLVCSELQTFSSTFVLFDDEQKLTFYCEQYFWGRQQMKFYSKP